MTRFPHPPFQAEADQKPYQRRGVRLARAVLLFGLWLGTLYPSPTQAQLVIRKDTTISQNFRAEGGLVVEAGATLTFDPRRSVTVESAGNVVIYGTLRMAPASPDVRNTLRILGADEATFVGGHTDRPLTTDRGLWVLGGGRLDIRGTPKTPWAPRPMAVEGWLPGDDIRIAPHTPGEFERFERVPAGFDWAASVGRAAPSLAETSKQGVRAHLGEATLAQIEQASGAAGVRPLAWPVSDLGHVDPLLSGTYPELLNLTRNVVIEGQPGARSHILIHTTQPAKQVIKFAEIKHMGPRRDTGERTHRGTRAVTEGYMGRYPLHFHMNGNNTRGSLIEGVVVRDSGHRAFVAHGSHGIRLEGTIAFDVFDSGYWWDPVTAGAPDERLPRHRDQPGRGRAGQVRSGCGGLLRPNGGVHVPGRQRERGHGLGRRGRAGADGGGRVLLARIGRLSLDVP